jgi:hypothetical protein
MHDLSNANKKQYMTYSEDPGCQFGNTTQTGQTSQMPPANGMQHISSKYDVELNPSNQHIFDDHQKQSSLITSQTNTFYSKKSSRRHNDAGVYQVQKLASNDDITE